MIVISVFIQLYIIYSCLCVYMCIHVFHCLIIHLLLFGEDFYSKVF